METEIQAQLAFHLTGRISVGELGSIDARALVPALFASCRNLTGLRYDFPLALISDRVDATSVQSLSGLIDGVLEDIAQNTDGERLRKHAWRLEQGIRTLVAQHGSGKIGALWETAAGQIPGHNAELWQDSLRRLRAAFKVDGDVVECDESMPFRLLQHAWSVLREEKTRRTRNTIEELIAKLSDILAAEFVHSDEGFSADRLKAAVGAPYQDAFDFGAMSRLLTQASPKTPLPEGRRRRIEWLLSVLKSQRFFGAAGSETPAVHQFLFDSCAAALQAFRGRQAEMVDLAKALAIAELEVEGRYHPSKHDLLFEDFGAHGLDPDQLALFPDYLIRCGPDDVPAVLKAFSAGLAAKVLVQIDDLLEPPSADAEHLSLGLAGKQIVGAAMASGTAFVLQASSANLFRLREQIFRGLAHTGPALFNVFTGTKPGAGDLAPYLVAAAATESRTFPDFVYDPSAGPDLASRFQVQTNPQAEADWPVHSLDYEDEAHQGASESLRFSVVDFLACDPRYQGYFAWVPRARWNDSMAPVSEFLNGNASGISDKVPYVLMVDRENVLHKAIVNEKLVRSARQCADRWHILQELGGIHNSHAAQLLARERKLWAERAAEPAEPATGMQPPESAAVSAAAPAVAAAPPTVLDNAEAQRSPDEAYIETERCSSCNECILINGKMFAYNANKQAFIADLNAGTYRQLVEAAESCQVSVIHPGKPTNPDEPGVEELLKRAEPFR